MTICGRCVDSLSMRLYMNPARHSREAGDSGFQVVIDYVWGRPAEVVLNAITRNGIRRRYDRDSLCADWGERGTDYLVLAAVLPEHRVMDVSGRP